MSGHEVSRTAVTKLEVRNLTKQFGPVLALDALSFRADGGEVHAICGENGAGKSTLVKLLTGIYQPDDGVIEIDGHPMTFDSPHDAQAASIACVSQEIAVCGALSVLDNIWLGTLNVPFLHKRAELRKKAKDALAMLGETNMDIDKPVAEFSMGERQLVEIARMLTRDARILILDEPTATLSDGEISRILTALKTLKKQGRVVLYITHRLAEVFELADKVTVLRNGALIETRSIDEVDRKLLIEMMLGRSFDETYPGHHHAGGEPFLSIRNLAIPHEVDRFSIDVRLGEVTYIVGQLGSGCDSLIRALAGLVYDASGEISINGRRVQLGSIESASENGIRFVSGDRAAEGIFTGLTAFDNLSVIRLKTSSPMGFIRWSNLRRIASDLATSTDFDKSRLHFLASQLSGGNQQKLAFGRFIGESDPKVLVMIEPTRGIDVGARATIYALMRNFCALGWGILVASTDFAEAVGIADVVATVYRGRLVRSYRVPNVAIPQIVADVTQPVH
jgi:ABC-type sugar transport system ATPase subunit